MPQTSVSQSIDRAFPGMQADLNKCQIDSFTSEEASAEIRPGIAVARGTADKGALILAAQADELVGIALHTHDFEQGGPYYGDDGFKPGATFGVAKKGRAYVWIEENVSAGGAVRVRAVPAGAEVAGAFRTTADGTDCVDLSAFCSWVEDGTAANGYAVLDFDFTQVGDAVADV